VHLAAGEFPETGERLSFRPLRQEDATVRVDERDGDDEDDGFRGCLLHDGRFIAAAPHAPSWRTACAFSCPAGAAPLP
jgi:hypothetical protein